MTPIKATVFILGSNHFARELLHYIRDRFTTATISRFGLRSDSEFYFVDDSNPDALNVKDYLNKISSTSGEYYSIMGTGTPEVKLRMAKEIVEPILSFIHPKATNLGKVGKGSVLAPGAVIAPNAVVGAHVLCNYNCTVGHDTVVDDYSTIGPLAAIGGNCKIGKGVYVGSGACIRENITIGDGATIGMNAIVTKDVPPGVTIIGVNERLKQWKNSQEPSSES